MLTRGNEAGGALQPGAAEKEFLEVPLCPFLFFDQTFAGYL
jgi:hypothetical protein